MFYYIKYCKIVIFKQLEVPPNFFKDLRQWFPNFSCARTTLNILVFREAQNIDFYMDWRTTCGPRSKLWESLT